MVYGYLQDAFFCALGAQAEAERRLAAPGGQGDSGGPLYEADLGGNILKKRVARPGQGKRGGFRLIVATRFEDQWFFIYGFAKNERDDIDKRREAAFKQWAADLPDMPAPARVTACEVGELTEVTRHGQ